MVTRTRFSVTLHVHCLSNVTHKLHVFPVTEYACSVWTPAGRKNVRNLQVVKSRYLTIVTNTLLYVSHKRTDEDLEVRAFACHITAPAVSIQNSWSGESLVYATANDGGGGGGEYRSKFLGPRGSEGAPPMLHMVLFFSIRSDV
jgi:hypothetical protein